MNPYKLKGPDDLSHRVLKNVSREASFPLFKVSRKLSLERIVPRDGKIAYTISTFKKGNETVYKILVQ